MMPASMPDNRPLPQQPDDIYRRQRVKNWLVAGLLLGFVLVVFVISLVRMSGAA